MKFSAISIIIAITLFCFHNAFLGDWVLDDNYAILKNKDSQISTEVNAEFFLHDFWGGHMNDPISHKSYRPLTVLLFRLANYLTINYKPSFNTDATLNQPEHKIPSVENSFYYHFFVIFLHLINTVLVYYLSIEFFFQDANSNNSFNASFISAILFGIHPVHCDAVSSCVGLAETLSGLFFLLSLLFYFRSIKSENHFYMISNFLFSIFLAFTGTLSKEQCLSVLGVSFAYDMIINNRAHLFQKIRLVTLLRCICLLFALFAFLSFRLSLNAGKHPPFDEMENHVIVEESRYVRFLSLSFLASFHFSILLFPLYFCCDWSGISSFLASIKNITDLRNLFSLFSFSIIAFLIYLSWNVTSFSLIEYSNNTDTDSKEDSSEIKTLQIRKASYVPTRPLMIGLIILIVSFMPSSNLIFPVGFVIAERILYLPSIGYCIILSWLIQYALPFIAKKLESTFLFLQKHNNKELSFSLFLIIALFYGFRTLYRNADWSNDFTLFSSAYHVNPTNPRILLNYAQSFISRDRCLEAVPYLVEAEHLFAVDYPNVKISNTSQAQALHSLLKCSQKHNDMDSGFMYVNKLESLDPDNGDQLIDIGVFYGMLLQNKHNPEYYRKAINSFSKAFPFKPYEASSNTALLMINSKKPLSRVLQIIKKGISEILTLEKPELNHIADLLDKLARLSLKNNDLPLAKKSLESLNHFVPFSPITKEIKNLISKYQ